MPVIYLLKQFRPLSFFLFFLLFDYAKPLLLLLSGCVLFFYNMQRDDHSATLRPPQCSFFLFTSSFFFSLSVGSKGGLVSRSCFFPLYFLFLVSCYLSRWVAELVGATLDFPLLLFSQHCHLLPYSVASAPFGTNVASPLSCDWSYFSSLVFFWSELIKMYSSVI